jgi:hypothetical protein
MAAVVVSSIHVGWLLTAAAGNAGSSLYSDEAPPHTFGLWLGIGLLVVAIVLVNGGIRLRRRRRLRSMSVLPDDPFAVEAMEGAVETFCRLESAWRRRDQGALRRLASGALSSSWRTRLATAPAGELVVEGPLSFEYMGAGAPSPGADRRAVVRVEGRLNAPSKQVSISRRQRNWLLGLAGAILFAAFVGIALAPATKIRSTPATTIVVAQGVPLGGTHLLTYRQGAEINLTVSSDVADEVHFHGYDIHRDVSPGHPVHFRIRATIQGSYPVELEQHGETLAQVTVYP